MKNKRKIINKYLKSLEPMPFWFHEAPYVAYSDGEKLRYLWNEQKDTYRDFSDSIKVYSLKEFSRYCQRMLKLKPFW